MRVEDLAPLPDWSAWATEGLAIAVAGEERGPIEVAFGPGARAWCAPRAIAWRDAALGLRADHAQDAALRGLATGPGRLALTGVGALASIRIDPGDTLRVCPAATLLATGGCIRLPPDADAWTAGLRNYGARERPCLLLLAGRGCLLRLDVLAGERILVSVPGLICVRGAIVLEAPEDGSPEGLPPLIACHGEGTLIVQSGAAH